MRRAVPEHVGMTQAERSKATYVVATLGLLIDVVGAQSFLGSILRQTQNEVASLIESSSESCASERRRAA